MGKPNVVFVLTDDQGYGDLACTGNPWIHTPNIDRFHKECVRFTDYHVSPLCTPTRGALMSGHRPIRNGAWATCWGRSILRKTEVTTANTFGSSGYRTGMFGKWHLGDNYPYRPQDRGFEKVVAHKGGGVGNTPDFWGNNYFDDTYFHNSQPVAHEGYCTDIWFEEGMKFIEEHKNQPFFCYIATNAPHGPYLVADKYADPYRTNPDIPQPEFYGMITNIDENFGRLRKHLRELGLEENTILIFMTDNGSSGGWSEREPRGYNAGMRGRKGSYYDGGHRVPFFIRWPAGGIQGGRDVAEMALHVDILPTFIDICGLTQPDGVIFDGRSLGPLLRGEIEQFEDDRHAIVQIRQSTEPPKQWTNCVATRDWRLIHGKELYRIKEDPGQENDIAEQHADVVERLRSLHDHWWEEIEPTLGNICAISLGNDSENPTCLNSMDVLGDVVWHHRDVIAAKRSTGKWHVDVERPGTYRFSMRRWPEELEFPIDGQLPREEAEKTAPYGKMVLSKALHPRTALLKLFDREETLPVSPGEQEIVFELQLDTTGETELEAWFLANDNDRQGAYYVYVERVGG